MAGLRVALLQLNSCGNDQQANLEKGETYCRQAAASGADIAVFPEMWNIGYTPYSEDVWKDDFNPFNPAYGELQKAWQAQGVSRQDELIRHYQGLAQELEMAIAVTYLEKWEPAPRDTVSLIDRHGEIVMTYAKVHTCDFSLEASCTPGDEFFVCTLDTQRGPVQVGAMICYDREFPESARLLMLKGAEIILVPNACEIEQNRMAQLRSRAYENMLAVALANYAGPRDKGHSVAFDGIAFDKQGSRDMLVVEAGENEGVFIAEFDLDRLRDYRERESWGNAYRKPRAYGELVSEEVRPPFVRKESRR
ncbi:MAG: carbon-nitrogen hydrolase family protein [Chloroflexi bacterium]|nr:carbon-nitrogen hydrolase family protein [Chloroflexota bacterium]